MNTRPRLPVKLSPGDRVCLLSPASPPVPASRARAGRARLQALGWEVVTGRAWLRRRGYLAGSDGDRAGDLARALAAPEIRAVFCTRGGYGAARILERFDPARLRPKILVGYSDITLLHLALQRGGRVGFWGPMPGTAAGITPFSARWLLRAIARPAPVGALPLGRGLGLVRRGRARGRLTGGTLTLLAASLGTPYAVETRGRIVFLEDVSEEPYRLDRLLTQLLAAGRLSDAAGIVLGRFTACGSRPRAGDRSLSVREVLGDRLLGLGVPVLDGLPLGHVPNQVTLPYGVMASVTAGPGRRFEILEPAVREP